MAGLLAVKPDGCSGGNFQSPGGEIGSVSRDGDETGIETDLISRCVRQEVTRCSEGGLGDSVVLSLKDESNRITNIGSDAIGSINQTGSTTNDDLMIDSGGGGCVLSAGESSGSGEDGSD